MPMFKMSASPQSHLAHTRAFASTSHKPIPPHRPQLPSQTPPIHQTQKNLTLSTPFQQPENQQFDMPTSMWPNTTANTSLFQHTQFPQQLPLTQHPTHHCQPSTPLPLLITLIFPTHKHPTSRTTLTIHHITHNNNG
jgi:hypothetical protein